MPLSPTAQARWVMRALLQEGKKWDYTMLISLRELSCSDVAHLLAYPALMNDWLIFALKSSTPENTLFQAKIFGPGPHPNPTGQVALEAKLMAVFATPRHRDQALGCAWVLIS